MGVQGFQEYTDHLEDLFTIVTQTPSRFAEKLPAIDAALNGEASSQLQNLVSLGQRRQAGAFFTCTSLAELAVAQLRSTIGPESIVYDPACGAGDLLLAVSNNLPLSKCLHSTLHAWNRKILGTDIHLPFVKASRLRIALAAIRRGVPVKRHSFNTCNLFQFINQGCGLTRIDAIRQATHILLNPPFTTIKSNDSTWANGGVNLAAVFLLNCVKNARIGTQIVAILPDVLRSGSRYKKWRYQINSCAAVNSVYLHGRFDRSADIDVFVLYLTVKKYRENSDQFNNPTSIGELLDNAVYKLRDKCMTSIGPVVDYRHPNKGPWIPFVEAKHLPFWTTIEPFAQRRYVGRTFSPPFVVVRRNSRPGDKHRAVATIIGGNRPVAVENHLIVIQPRSQSLRACRSILQILKSSQTTTWLNQRIRCRHLTLESLNELPWWES